MWDVGLRGREAESGLLALEVSVDALRHSDHARRQSLRPHRVGGGVKVGDDVEHRRGRVARHARLLAQVLPQPLRLRVGVS